ncbi:cytidylyltransferase domain-containing protein [Agarivorans sp. DSG3-1]|uniref:acylneuraminate cytidylyltransferase family protein n=1 Tax=Agarivorans sp. DSG3-1 TaxID=3342249 RepID=UPI00398F7BEA
MIIGIVPARSGSKGFKNKNISKIKGVTLLELAVDVGLGSELLSNVFVSTDSVEYEAIALNRGAKSLGIRPKYLASDCSKTIDVVLDLISKPTFRNVTHIVLLQPTSPVRDSKLVDECIDLALKSNESVVTVAQIEDPHPYKVKKITNGVLVPFIDNSDSETPRQQFLPAYELTGAVYVSSVENILMNKSFFSDGTKSIKHDLFVNIDSEQDFFFFEFMVNKGLVEL